MAKQQQKWIDSGLIPAGALEAWHACVPGETGNSVIYDYSGNDRTAAAASNSPVLVAGVIGSEPGLYFDGTRNPLVFSGEMPVKHVFCLCSFSDALFPNYNAVLSAPTSHGLLVGNQGANRFFHLPDNDPYAYYKNGLLLAPNAETAPVGGAFALCELIIPDGITLDGLQIGQDRGDPLRKWKGFFIESMVFSSVCGEAERRAIYLYFALKFRASMANSLPVYFPTPDMIRVPAYSRFLDEAPDYDVVTDSVVYADKSEDRNQFAPEPPERWEIEYNEIDREKAFVLEQFWKAVRLVKRFNFLDKYGDLHTGIQVNKYKRDHQGHKSWEPSVKFDLVRFQRSTGGALLGERPDLTPVILTAALPGGIAGAAYNQTIFISGGNAPVTLSIVSPNFPASLNFNAAARKITGNLPGAAGSYSITVRATDIDGDYAERTFVIVVTAAMSGYTMTNFVQLKTLNGNTATPDQLLDFAMTMISDLAIIGNAPTLTLSGYTATNFTPIRTLSGDAATYDDLLNFTATLASDLSAGGNLSGYSVGNYTAKRVLSGAAATTDDLTNLLLTVADDLGAMNFT